MGNVVINGRTAVHAGSGGTLNTPDVCKTPRKCRPQTYNNVAVSSDSAQTAGSVIINGNPACHKDSMFSKSAGDEPGSCGGTKSGTIKGAAHFVTFSNNVFIEGIPAVRQFDLMTSNMRNTPPMPLMQPGASQPPELSPDGAGALDKTELPYAFTADIVGNETHMLKSLLVFGDDGQDAGAEEPDVQPSKQTAAAVTGVATGATATATVKQTDNEKAAEAQKLTRLKIYAEAIYGIKPAEFSMEKLKTKAKIDLGVSDESKLILKNERIKNFELFKEKHFSNIDNLAAYSGNEPEPHMTAYKEIEKYALSSYGSLMIKNVLSQKRKPKFIIGVSDNPDTKAHGQYDDNFIVLPANFPSAKYFAVSKQQILGVAIIHHEFEHTKHGKFKNTDLGRGVLEEWKAVRYNENPVRIIHGLEPRYVYYSNEAGKTINIISKQTKTGKWRYNMLDPSKSMIK